MRGRPPLAMPLLLSMTCGAAAFNSPLLRAPRASVASTPARANLPLLTEAYDDYIAKRAAEGDELYASYAAMKDKADTLLTDGPVSSGTATPTAAPAPLAPPPLAPPPPAPATLASDADAPTRDPAAPAPPMVLPTSPLPEVSMSSPLPEVPIAAPSRATMKPDLPEMIHEASDLLSHQAIMENFVHHNPWEALQNMEFYDALQHVEDRQAHMSPGERLSSITPLDPRVRANKAMAELGAPFLDRGLAKWEAPNREKGFLYFFASLEGLGLAPWRGYARNAAIAIMDRMDRERDLDVEMLAAEILEQNLMFFEDDPTLWTETTRSIMLDLPGWAGMFKRMEEHPSEGPARYPRLTSHLSPLTSHLSPLTSHLTRPARSDLLQPLTSPMSATTAHSPCMLPPPPCVAQLPRRHVPDHPGPAVRVRRRAVDLRTRLDRGLCHRRGLRPQPRVALLVHLDDPQQAPRAPIPLWNGQGDAVAAKPLWPRVVQPEL